MKKSLITLSLASATLMAANLSARPEGMPPPPDPETVVVDMFTDYDANENNSLDQAELVAALKGIREKHRAERQGNRPRMGRPGPDGEPPADRPMKPGRGERRGPPPPEDIAPNLIQNFDTNGDGELNTEEMLAAMRSLHERGSRARFPRNAASSTDSE